MAPGAARASLCAPAELSAGPSPEVLAEGALAADPLVCESGVGGSAAEDGSSVLGPAPAGAERHPAGGVAAVLRAAGNATCVICVGGTAASGWGVIRTVCWPAIAKPPAPA